MKAPKMASFFDQGSIYGKAERRQAGTPSKETQRKEKQLEFEFGDDSYTDFIPTTGTLLSSTNELCAEINKRFSVLYEDWYGSRVRIGDKGQISVDFIFKPSPNFSADELSKCAFVPLDNDAERNDRNDILKQVIFQNMVSRSKNRHFKLTNFGSESLEKFLFNGIQGIDPFEPETFHKQNLIAESEETNSYGHVETIFVVLTGIDVYKLLSVIFGPKEKGSRLTYTINPIRLINVNNAADWLITIDRMSNASYNAAMTKLGYNTQGSGLGAVTDIAE